jgi:NAD(P)-dependent dehydrogenase (short-subunit alcohol dehydrogenase family)
MLENKIVFITGGAGLIGRSFVEALVEQNATIVIGDIDLKSGNKLKKEIQDKFPNSIIEVIEFDITNKCSITKGIEYCTINFNKIDVLINNAYPRNKNYGKHFFDVTFEDFNENVNLNLGGYFLTSQQFALYFKKQGYGNIINISSIYGVVPPKFEIYEETDMTVPVEYAAIKSALIHLTKYMAKYLKGTNIRVNCLSPGGIFDNQNEKFLSKYNDKCLNKGMLDANDLTGTLLFLISDQSKYINGQNLIVDDGFTL